MGIEGKKLGLDEEEDPTPAPAPQPEPIPVTPPVRTIVEKMHDAHAQHDAIVQEAYQVVWDDLKHGIILWVSLASVIVAAYLIANQSGRRSRSQFGNTRVNFFPRRPDSIIVH
jgi:hypothetical protein